MTDLETQMRIVANHLRQQAGAEKSRARINGDLYASFAATNRAEAYERAATFIDEALTNHQLLQTHKEQQ